jgi:hypothetical protein
LTLSTIASLPWPPTLSDQHMYYAALLSMSNTSTTLRWSLDYCSELVINWHQLRRDDRATLPRRMPPFHHFNGPNKRLPAGWEEASARAAAGASTAATSPGSRGV